ncbi:MAG: radical SAM protein, partial [Selenomonadaceae bacterium]|nr:radical SAM protein [Selenomonadaceae bacterium]
AFRLLRERGFQTSVSMCLHRHNIGGLKESIDLLAGEGVCHVKMNVASPTGRWKNETEHFISQDVAFEAIEAYLPQYVADGMPVSAQFCGFIDFNREARKILIPFRKYSGMEGADRAFACGAVKNGMYISPTGKILPCMTLGGTAIDPMFESALEKPLSEILSDSHYRDICLAKMGDCIAHNEACRDCQYRLACGAGCRACACGETGTDYFGIDEDACHFFKSGWYERAQALVERYKDSFPPAPEGKQEGGAAALENTEHTRRMETC